MSRLVGICISTISQQAPVVTDNKKSFFIDLESRRPATSNLLPSEYDCAFAFTGNGDLFVVNYACDPFFVSYSPSLDTITVSTITPQARDSMGMMMA